YVAWAADLGIVKGFPDGTFRPYEAITREQMATATDRFLSAVGLNTIPVGGIFDFADEKKISDWAVPSVGNLKKIGIFTGDNKGRFNPEANTTRAEAATVVMRLRESINSAWQGYVPTAGADAFVYGAKYLFQNGAILSGGMKRGLDESGEYPLLTLETDAYAANATYLFPNETGISVNYGEIDIFSYPVVKICYGFDGMEETVPGAVFSVNMTRTESSGYRKELTPVPGEDDEGMKTATVDLTETITNNQTDLSVKLAEMLFTPCARDYDGDGRFTVLYIGFFKTQADADAFRANGDADIADYLKNYESGYTADYREYTDETRAYYDKLLVDRIAEIRNSESELTPETVKARGGKCYFISSVRGDDKNDGLSPETPWKSLSKLKRSVAGGQVYVPVVKKGDGVFFERGSVFYPEIYYNESVCTLECVSGADYGAYGEGPKPLFTGALDFTDSNNAGNWEPTGYPNVWKIACIDDTITERTDDGTEQNWLGARSEIGNMFFDGGRAVGLRIVAKGSKQTLGEGIKSYEKGRYFNGLEYYYSEKRSLENPGTALLHNLEFFHDYETGSLYLYWDKGNPADSFDDIKASRKAYIAFVGDNSWIDNIAFLYTARHCIDSGSTNVKYTNCEIGCAGGVLESAESGIEVFGPSDGIYMINNYLHDVYDGALSSQNTNVIDGEPIIINNVNHINNVIVACGNGSEIWNHQSNLDENGVSASKITNCTIKGNIMAYNGYGPRMKQDTGAFHSGEYICGSMYGEYENCRIEDNVFLYGVGSVYYAYMATYRQPRGWESLGNVYILDPEINYIGFSYETLNYINHGMWKRVRTYFPYTVEGLAWYTSLGIDPKGVFYHFTSGCPYKDWGPDGYFFMDGYYAALGEDPAGSR
ncbi:MAG: S-layer homology domain-containing protein, partial [Clostridia bacterium]|nr:S-layer homology domain-containing protein [Clostridia bacterium]